MNVAVYGHSRQRWAFSEHPRAAVKRAPERLEMGRSRVRWEGGTLVVDVDERAAPMWNPRSIRGRVEITPAASPCVSFQIDPDGRHRWWPIAPAGRAVVELRDPALRFEGSAYLDSNFGDEPLAEGFSSWHWSRATLANNAATVLYDAVPRRGEAYERALRFDTDGTWSWSRAPMERVELPRAGWGVARATRADRGASPPTIARAFEDSPFYTRELLHTTLEGEAVHAVHESIDLDRWRRPVVQAMLPFRMRRWRV